MTLGHEVSGEIQELGSSVADLVLGMRVAVDPSRPCRSCDYCRAGRSNLCRQMRFLGSAAVMPHVQGGFRQSLVVRADQCLTVPDGLPLRVVACAEPLSVALHGVRPAGELLGSFRFHQEFRQAVALLQSGAVDVVPILSAEFPLTRADSAFAIAGDRSQGSTGNGRYRG